MRLIRPVQTLGLLSLVLAPLAGRSGAETVISVDCAKAAGPLDSDLWSSSGLAQGLGTSAFRQDLQLIGSVPYGGCRWIRPHFLLNLVRVAGLGEGKPVYDWSAFDRTIDTAVAANLKPLFELMGNPSGQFTNFLDRGQAYAWRDLVAALARHLEARYGAAEVRSWLFESWNEPDIKDSRVWKSFAEHQNYYDACSEGLKAVDPQLRLGGPGVAHAVGKRGAAFFDAFLSHCETGANYFTGETGVRLDFISFHCKNLPSAMIDSEVGVINGVLRDHPRFASLPIFNDEADSEVGWSKPFLYRATPWYAAFIARSVDEHLRRIVDGASITGGRKIDYRLSNDDAFWGPWPFRAQLAHFGTDAQFAFVKKPSHTVRTALALLGDERFAVIKGAPADGIGAIATQRGANTVAVLVYNYSDKTDTAGSAMVRLELEHLPFGAAKWVHYRIDSEHGDTHRLWQDLGAPEHPSDARIQALRNQQELGICEPISEVSGPSLSRTIQLPLPGVSVILICADPGPSREPISGFYATAYPSISGQKEDVMLKWTGLSRVVKTYEVLYSARSAGPFTRVNPSDLIETGFIHQLPSGQGGFAKVRATDFWGRVVGESGTVALNSQPPEAP